MERGQRHPIFATRSPTRPKCWQDWATEDETVCHLPEAPLSLSPGASVSLSRRLLVFHRTLYLLKLLR